ncbi:MAG TPA: RNA polymerase sigma factor [Gaiellaceae bacterium]|nr:RNA polymerase sigma factor [Gaiellaceae bacterium]
MRRRPDIELVVLAREGSREAAGALFDRYWILAWRTAYAITADRALADDAGQEAFVKAFAALERFDETQPLAPWLKRITINTAVDSLRRSRRLEVVHDEESTFHTWALGDSAEDDLRRWAVTDAVASLGVAKRVVVVLHYWLDLPLEEIAGVLGLPIGTIASRLARAKEELRSVLEDERVV